MKLDYAVIYWMAGVALAHGARFLVFDDPIGRQIVAGGGLAVYGGIALAMGLSRKTHHAHVLYVLMIAFPVVGVSTVLATGSPIDDWQLAVGFTQFAAAAYAAGQLWWHS